MKNLLLVISLLSLGLLADVARAQGEVPPGAPRGSTGEIEEALRVRGMPLRLVDELRENAPKLIGREEGGNGFRSRTPLFEKAKARGRKVDLEALRRRKLAMYEEGAVFTQDLPFVDPDPEPLRLEKAKRREVQEEGIALWKVLASLGLLAISGTFAWIALKKSP